MGVLLAFTSYLPQHFAEEFGWPEMVASVGSVYAPLPPEEGALGYVVSLGVVAASLARQMVRRLTDKAAATPN